MAGYGENMRVLKWMLDRIDGRAGAVDTPVGRAPGRIWTYGWMHPGSDAEDLAVKKDEWSKEVASAGEFFTHSAHDAETAR